MEERQGSTSPVASSTAQSTNRPGQEQLTDLTERIVELESLVRNLMNDRQSIDADTDGMSEGARERGLPLQPPDDTSSVDTTDDIAVGSHPTVEILRLPEGGLQFIGQTIIREELKQHAIIAFYEEPDIDNILKKDMHGTQQDPLRETMPCCIVIQSPIINSLLTEISGETFNDGHQGFLPPYKVFTRHWNSIQENVTNLRNIYDQKLRTDTVGECGDRTQPEVNGTGVVSGPNDSTLAEFDHERIKHLELFINTIETHLARAFTLRRMIQDRELQKICFSDIWHLFNPGDLVLNHISSKGTRSYAYQIYCVTGGRRDAEEHETPRGRFSQQVNPLLLRALALDYDGVRVGPTVYDLEIQPYPGEKLITDLAYFPKQFAADEIRIQDLLDRGRQFVASRYGHAMYEGSVSYDNQFVEGEFFVDFKSGYEAETDGISRPKMEDIMTPTSSGKETDYVQYRSSAIVRRFLFREDESVDVERCEKFLKGDSFPGSIPDERIEELKHDHLLLLPDYVVGYSLRTKEWHELTVRHVRLLSQYKKQRGKPFDSLVIPGKYKRILKAMVEDHTENQSIKQNIASGRDLDLVSGKGRGLIIFLYGPPGVGKTSTAETIAAYTTPPRPLYPITCGDLGTTPDQIQQRLQSHFRLAHRWNCVLLLDEADVYLVERDINDLKRNGIVSVFLRTLEYYSGILFLTSNREGSIDEAFKSRIHIALHYKRINSEGNTQIWNNMLDRIEQTNHDSEKKLPIAFDREKLLSWAKKHFERHDSDSGDDPGTSKFSTWNGRQIRNAFQTAIALASYDRLEKLGEAKLTPEQAMKKSRWRKVHLLPSHFDRVEEVVGEFQQYLNVVRKPDHVRAQTRGLRNDDWDGQPRQPQSAYGSKSRIHARYASPTASQTGRPALREPRPNPSKPPTMRPAKPSREVPPRTLDSRPATLELDEDYVNEAYDDPYGDGSDSEEEEEQGAYNQSGTDTDGEGQ